MKKRLFLLMLCSVGAAAQTPDKKAQHDLVEQGVKLYDAGQYPEAVAKYQQALAAVPNDPYALSELALTYNAMSRHKEAVDICQKLLKADPDADESVYVTYGNSLDALKKTKDAYRAYEDGLKHHPASASLYFNLGVAQATSGQAPASIGSFQQAVALSPDYASVHMSLGVMQLASNARIPAILGLGRFLVLEPRGARATQRLPLLDKAMSQGVTRTEANAVTLSLTVEDVRAAGRKRDQPDDFGLTEMMLNLVSARTIAKDSGTAVSRFAEQFSWICKSLAEHSSAKQTGFTWNYYVPYFVEMEKKGYVTAFAYLTHASQAEVPEVQQWLAAHPNEVAVFQEWSKNYAWPRAVK